MSYYTAALLLRIQPPSLHFGASVLMNTNPRVGPFQAELDDINREELDNERTIEEFTSNLVPDNRQSLERLRNTSGANLEDLLSGVVSSRDNVFQAGFDLDIVQANSQNLMSEVTETELQPEPDTRNAASMNSPTPSPIGKRSRH
jgi:hypothetical protein